MDGWVNGWIYGYMTIWMARWMDYGVAELLGIRTCGCGT